MQSLLEELRRLRQREERARLEAHGHEKVPGAFGSPEREAGRPDVEEALLLHRTANRRDDARAQAEVALHALGAQVEPAVAEAQGLVHALLVELERERRRARDDLELVHVELDLAGRHLRVDGLGRARDDLALGPQHEFVADLLRELGGGRRALRVDDELHEPVWSRRSTKTSPP